MVARGFPLQGVRTESRVVERIEGQRRAVAGALAKVGAGSALGRVGRSAGDPLGSRNPLLKRIGSFCFPEPLGDGRVRAKKSVKRVVPQRSSTQRRRRPCENNRLLGFRSFHLAGECFIHAVEETDEAGHLCRLNLAVHALEGNMHHAAQVNNHFDDPHKATGQFDFVLANPPFNVNALDTGIRATARRHPEGTPQDLPDVQNHERLKDTVEPRRRFPFGLPRTDAANYLWIQLSHYPLSAKSRAGVVMANRVTMQFTKKELAFEPKPRKKCVSIPAGSGSLRTSNPSHSSRSSSPKPCRIGLCLVKDITQHFLLPGCVPTLLGGRAAGIGTCCAPYSSAVGTIANRDEAETAAPIS